MLPFETKKTVFSALKKLMTVFELLIMHECLLTMKEVVTYSDEEFISYICSDPETIRMFIKYLRSTIEAEYSPSLDSISQITSSETNKNIDILLEFDLLEAMNVVMTQY